MPYLSKAERRKKILSESGLEKIPLGIARPLSKTELATFLDVSQRFLEGEVKEGRLRGIRLSNRAMRFLPRDVQSWLDAKATTEVEA
jgi:hypothetical protein